MNEGRPEKAPKATFKVQYKLLLCAGLVIVASIALLLILTYRNTAALLEEKSTELLLSETQKVHAEVAGWVEHALATLEVQRDALQYFDLDEEGVVRYMRHTAGQHSAYPAGIYLGLTDGQLLHASFVPPPGYEAATKSWYQEGLASEKFIFGSVYFDDDSQSYVVGASGVFRDSAGRVQGVAAADIYLDAISGMVADARLEDNGGSFLVEMRSGMVIGHFQEALVGQTLEQLGDNELYAFVRQMLAEGRQGLMSCDTAGLGELLMQIDIIENSGWAAISFMPTEEVFSDLQNLTRFLVRIAVIAVVLLLVLMYLVIHLVINRPLRRINRVVTSIAQGNLDESIDYRSRDEFGVIASNFGFTVDRLRLYIDYIAEITAVLGRIADGNLNFTLVHDYSGDFVQIRRALEHISSSLNQTLSHINKTADQVSIGSAQLAAGAQTLSQGTVDQSGSIEQLNGAISDISTKMQKSAGNAQDARSMAEAFGGRMAESHRQMEIMGQAMQDISNSSREIGNIINTIEDIAFQTNILSLNASVEAARAGSAGKGFAVVADEVSNLASKSQAAAQSTAELIEKSLQQVASGAKIAEATIATLNAALADAREITQMIEGISAASSEQAAHLGSITSEVDQISGIVHATMATAEQSAAASEELSQQAQVLKELVGQFTLRGEAGAQPEAGSPHSESMYL